MPLTRLDLAANATISKASDFLLYPWLQPGRLTLLVGPTEVGKTTLTLELLAAVLRGGYLWNKFPCTAVQKILYLHAEHTFETVQEATAIRGDIPIGRVEVIQDFGVDGPALLKDGRPNTHLVRELAEAIKEVQPGLIIAEPISAFLEVSENDNREARALIQTLCALAESSRAAILTHHHVGKSYFNPETAKQRKAGLPTGEARGAQAFEDAAERVLYLRRGNEGQVVIETPKAKGYRIAPVTLSFDEDRLTYTRIANELAERDLLTLHEYHRTHPDISVRDLFEHFRVVWKAGTPRIQALWNRCHKLGLVAPSDPV